MKEAIPIPTLLLTGFEPFGGEPINPSQEAVQQLNRLHINGYDVVSRSLPVTFNESIEVLKRNIDEVTPELIICVGQAGGRSAISLEKVAINLSDGRIPDNNGVQPIDEPINASGPVAYWSSLPVKAMAKAIREAGIPAEVSHTAGTYVCNHLFYGLMDVLKDKKQSRGGFIHIPFIPEQAVRHPGQPSISLQDVVHGLRIAVETAINCPEDLRERGGSIH